MEEEGKGKHERPQAGVAVSKGFDEWYEAYPRKVGKGAARMKYAAALKRTDGATLLAGAKRAAKQYAKTDPKYTPHPATWLHQERWLDEEQRPAKTRDQQAEDDLYALVN